MTKQELRKAYFKKRLLLSEIEYEKQNILLCKTFFKSIDLSNTNVILTFLPIVKNHEPNTWLILNHLKKNYPVIEIAIPKIDAAGEMTSYLLDEKNLEINSWEIPEPRGGTIVPPHAIDLILVPLLAFDKQGHRVGYGKGYYDRFLKSCRTDSLKIGLSFFPPEEKITDIYKEDFPIDMVITPFKLYTFNK